MARKSRYVVGLDIGTTKVTTILGELDEDGGLDVIGIGTSPSRGLRRGVVVNLDTTIESIKKSIEEAELMSGVEVESVLVGIAGSHLKGFNSRGVIAVTGREREVDSSAVARVIEAARAVSIPPDREVIHVLPQEFIVDEQDGIKNPKGMTGTRLEVNVHIITAAVTALQNLFTCVSRAGVDVDACVVEQLAAAEAVLTEDEKELGVAMVDIGGGTTDLAIYEHGAVWHTAVLPIGGEHFTNDIAVGLRTPVHEAEKIKKKYGCAQAALVKEDEVIEIPSVGDRKPRVLARQLVAEILEPRAHELMALVKEEISRAGYEKSLTSGVVLTGGGVLLDGLVEVAEQVFDLPVRRGAPAGVGGLTDVVASPAYATAVGLVLWGLHNSGGGAARVRAYGNTGLWKSVGTGLKGWLAEFF